MAFFLACFFLCMWLTIVIQRVVSLFYTVKFPCCHLDMLSFISRKLDRTSLSLCQKAALGLWKVASLLESHRFILLACITTYLLYVNEACSFTHIWILKFATTSRSNYFAFQCIRILFILTCYQNNAEHCRLVG